MVGHRRCAVGDETALLSARVGTGLVDPVHIQASFLQSLRFAHRGSQHPDTEPLGHVLRAQRRVARGSKAPRNQSLRCVQSSDFLTIF